MTKQEYISKEFTLTPREAEEMLLAFLHDIIARSPNVKIDASEKAKHNYTMQWAIGLLETRELRED